MSSQSRTVTVMWWNRRWGSDIPKMLAVIDAVSPDVLFLLENMMHPSDPSSCPDRIVEQHLGSTYYHSNMLVARRKAGLEEVTSVYACHSLAPHSCIGSTLSRGGRIATRSSERMLVELSIRLPGSDTRVRLGAVHLSYGWPLFNRLRLVSELHQIKSWYYESLEPAIFAGDFNSTPQVSTGFQAYGGTFRQDDLIIPGDKPRRYGSEQSTYASCAILPFRGHGLARCIDYGFGNASGRALVESCWLGDRGPSNHRPLIMRLSAS